MPTIWKWIIVTEAGHFTGDSEALPPKADRYSNILRDIQDVGYFQTEDEARDYATKILNLAEDEFEICNVFYASVNSSF